MKAQKIFWMIVKRRSFGWWTKENLLDDGPKKIFWMMVQRRSLGRKLKKCFPWLSKEGLLDDKPKKIFWMMAQRRSFGRLSKEDYLDEGSKRILSDDGQKKIFWMMVQRRAVSVAALSSVRLIWRAWSRRIAQGGGAASTILRSSLYITREQLVHCTLLGSS